MTAGLGHRLLPQPFEPMPGNAGALVDSRVVIRSGRRRAPSFWLYGRERWEAIDALRLHDKPTGSRT